MAKNNILIQASRKRFDELDRDDPRFYFGMFKNFNYIIVPDFPHGDLLSTRFKIEENKVTYTIFV